MSMQKIKINDEVIVISGRDKGNKGRVKQIIGDKYVVENINMVTKHQKENPNQNKEAGLVKKEVPIHKSNVAIYNDEIQGPDRVGFSTNNDGQKVRVFKKTDKIID